MADFDPQKTFELTQKIIDAIEQVLGPMIENTRGEFPQDFSIEQFIDDVRNLVPEAPPEVVVAYLQLYLSPIGEGEEGDIFFGESYGEDGDYSNFAFDSAFLDEQQQQYEQNIQQQLQKDQAEQDQQ